MGLVWGVLVCQRGTEDDEEECATFSASNNEKQPGTHTRTQSLSTLSDCSIDRQVLDTMRICSTRSVTRTRIDRSPRPLPREREATGTRAGAGRSAALSATTRRSAAASSPGREGHHRGGRPHPHPAGSPDGARSAGDRTRAAGAPTVPRSPGPVSRQDTPHRPRPHHHRRHHLRLHRPQQIHLSLRHRVDSSPRLAR